MGELGAPLASRQSFWVSKCKIRIETPLFQARVSSGGRLGETSFLVQKVESEGDDENQ